MFIEQHNERVLISCSAGRSFSGNSKQLFDVMYTNNKDVYFITRNKKLLNKLNPEYGKKIIFSYSFYALYIFVTSRVVVLSHGVYDVTPFYPFHSTKKVINLWHGFPFKNIGVKMDNLSQKQVDEIIDEFSKTDYMISSSEIESTILSESFGLDISRVKITGYPRYDLLLKKDFKLLSELGLSPDKKIILYAPTYRDVGDVEVFPFDDFSLEKLNIFLEELDIILLLRFHSKDIIKVENKIKFNTRIINFNQNKLEDVNEILPLVDMLITDYSSIFMDFVLVDKPLMFFPYDAEEYTKIRGFNFELEDIYPGSIIFTFSSFLQNAKAYINNPSIDDERRESIIKRFHQYQIGSSTNKVIELIEEL